MKINQEIISRIKELEIPINDGLSYLLSVYFDCVPSTTSRVLVKHMQFTKILGISNDKKLVWLVPLFQKSEIEEKWEWVTTEYRELFKNVNPKRSGPKSSSISRMKRFFRENPDIRKDDVIAATKMYIRNLDDSNYITSAHYFIFKGSGSNLVSGLEDWVDKYKGQMYRDAEDNDVTNIMQ